MFDQSVQKAAKPRPAALQMPLQARPVDRTGMHTAAVTDAVGVEADSWFDDIVSGIGTVAKVAGPLLGAL
ncbi:hypothetical protein [Kitasatospora griseola]|uniref:hypothetical protein n=1 Tax=Kitasatospora griseola TaxID=2064 RepID=UPI0016710BDC|nr:hypothetical protein [Kitasatospora griseola]GGR00777.1 hypothetical protein GCM10010195_65740 [Kitasatospora griseola]